MPDPTPTEASVKKPEPFEITHANGDKEMVASWSDVAPLLARLEAAEKVLSALNGIIGY